MRLWVPAAERRPNPAPVNTDDRKAFLAGTVLWLVALAVVLVVGALLSLSAWIAVAFWDRLGGHVLGLPGNPASALVCAELFLAPLLAALQGGEPALPLRRFRLAEPLPAEGPREHWLRATLAAAPDGALEATALPDQDSSLVTVLAAAGALIRRDPNAPAALAGALVDGLPLLRS